MSRPTEIDEIAGLLAAMEAAGVAEVEIEGPDARLHLRLEPEGMPAGAAQAREPAETAPPTLCRAPAAGFLLLQHPAAGRPLLAPGAPVAAGDTVALIRTGLLLRPVTAPATGRLRWLVESGALLGYGTPLAEIEPQIPH